MTKQLRVDWPSCKGRGLCHEILPEAIQLDEWGYPLVVSDIDEDTIGLAREAVKVCPTLALRMVDARR
ncbi:MAG TPA: ferredoxin [Nocardioides sp.]|uniref:ferredoxin n=1 Tax=Nocardioides sp. TaxID=35761 RepID=UPI002D7FA587|nr:ferredoxin [Nocardioides sp.]HET6653824.1 ferredoxin [Nocardioides sp.]